MLKQAYRAYIYDWGGAVRKPHYCANAVVVKDLRFEDNDKDFRFEDKVKDEG